MCGIAGWVFTSSQAPGPSLLQAMGDRLSHRGPDGHGTFFANTRDNGFQVGLAHRRLAIIDLSTGEQPMHSEDGMLTIVFNGEIYNFAELRDELSVLGHRFRTTSDTEVLIKAYHQWGTDCLSRLRGMYAFALWDARREQLFLARDRFGKKPLYLWRQGQNMLFGSEIKSLLAHPAVKKELDHHSVLDYLHYRYVPGPNTFFKDIQKLPPGSFAVYKNGALSIQHSSTTPDATVSPGVDPGEAKALSGFMSVLDDSVRLRMVSDVPFGAFLSGGLDSSTIVALMSRHSNLPINTFSLGFKEDTFSELPYARLVAEKFKTNHHESIMVADDVIDLLPEVIGYYDAPVAEPTDVAVYTISKEAAKSVKMVLTGEGSDEILAGYPKHKFEPYAQTYQAFVPAFLHEKIIQPLIGALPHSFYRARTLIDSMGLRDPKERLPRWFGALNYAEREALCALDLAPRPVSGHPFADPKLQPLALRRALYFDQTSWLPDNLLERGDRMNMAASIEGRMPFMDHELAAYMTQLTDTYRIRGGVQKWILREAMKPVLPEEILTRRKVGFRVPVSEWFRTTLWGYLQANLLGNQSKTRDFYRRAELERILNEHRSGKKNHEKLLWALLNLELFAQRHDMS